MTKQVNKAYVKLNKEIVKIEISIRAMRSRTILVALREFENKPKYVKDLETQFQNEVTKKLTNRFVIDELLDELEGSVPISLKAISLAKQPVTLNV